MSFAVIAIDGPAGAGKSTIAKRLAQKLYIQYFDTGATYRAFGWKAMQLGVSLTDEPALSELVTSVRIHVSFENNVQKTWVDHTDVTALLRSTDVSHAASCVGVVGKVREYLSAMQRSVADSFSLVAEGRDMGTFVFPDASCKFFLTASREERAHRRQADYAARGENFSLDSIIEEISRRDERDSSRAIAPLVQAADAIGIDSTFLTVDQVVDLMIASEPVQRAFCPAEDGRDAEQDRKESVR